jgi:hypothetical protein
MPDAAAPRDSRRDAGPARHELPTIDDAALAAARETDRLLGAARDAGDDRWVAFFAPLPDRLRDGDLRDVQAAARKVRAAYGPKDSVRDVFPDDVTEPVINATDRLLKVLARHAAKGDR